MTNSTIVGNHGGIIGGTILLRKLRPGAIDIANITHSTISGNDASAPNSSGGAIGGTGSANAVNSIVAGNTSASTSDISADVQWTQTSTITSTTGLNLGSLADNGGPTQTMLPGSGSTAINAVACLPDVTTDQRGKLRPDAASAGLATPCDIGAVEVGSLNDLIFANGFETSAVP